MHHHAAIEGLRLAWAEMEQKGYLEDVLLYKDPCAVGYLVFPLFKKDKERIGVLKVAYCHGQSC